MSAPLTLADFSVSPRFDVDEVTDSVGRLGVAVLPGWLGPDRLEPLHTEFDKLLASDDPDLHRFEVDTGRGVSLDRRAAYMGAYPAIDAVFEDAKMERVAERFLGRPYHLNHEVYATYDYKGGQPIVAPHFDKLNTLKFMIYLKDVGPEDGAFGVIPGSPPHARRAFRELFTRHGIYSLSVHDPRYHEMGNDRLPPGLQDPVPIVAPAGTLIVFETDTIHQGGPLGEGHERRILRGHSGVSTAFAKVRRYGRQWWRGEKPPDPLRRTLARILG